jgi:hypothetical protein
MNNSLAAFVPLVYALFLLGLFTYLLSRGITHSFIAFFAAGALMQLVLHLGLLALREMPGGFSATRGYYPLLSIVGLFGTLCFAVGFLLLAKVLLRAAKPVA